MLPEGPAILHECLVTGFDMANREEKVVHDSSMIYLQEKISETEPASKDEGRSRE